FFSKHRVAFDSMSQSSTHSASPVVHASGALALADFGALQTRYQALPVSQRAQTVLKDAEPALQTAQAIIEEIITYPRIDSVFDHLRGNAALIGKMRGSE